MRNANTQTMPKILVLNDLIPAHQHISENLIHWDFPEEDEPYGEVSCFNSMDWHNDSDEQEWRDDYTASIRL